MLLVTALFKNNFHVDDNPALELLHRVVMDYDIDVSEKYVSSIFRPKHVVLPSFCVCRVTVRWRGEVREPWLKLHPFFSAVPTKLKHIPSATMLTVLLFNGTQIVIKLAIFLITQS